MYRKMNESRRRNELRRRLLALFGVAVRGGGFRWGARGGVRGICSSYALRGRGGQITSCDKAVGFMFGVAVAVGERGRWWSRLDGSGWIRGERWTRE